MIPEVLLSEITRLLSDKYQTPVKIMNLFSLGGGCIHNACRLETSIGKFFLKYNHTGPKEIFLREAESLNELSLAKTVYLKIPEVVFASAITELPGFLLLEYLYTGSGGAESGTNLGRGLAEIHRCKGSYFGFAHNNYCGLTLQDNTPVNNWIDFFSEKRILHLLTLIKNKKGFTATEVSLIEKFVLKLPSLLPSHSEPGLIHGDLWSGNYMITTSGPALIDPAACYADREMEFGILTLFGGFSNNFWQGYNEVYPLPDDWKKRNPIYQSYHLLNHFYLFGGNYGNQALSIFRYYTG